MRCQSVASVVVYGFLVSPADVQPLFLPRFKAIMQALQFPPCVWWCSGGLFKLLIRKIISPNKCDTLSRWLIIKRVSLFPFMLWLISTCWGYTSYSIGFDPKLFSLLVVFPGLVKLCCLKYQKTMFLVCLGVFFLKIVLSCWLAFIQRELETSDLEQICNQSKSAGEATKRNMHNCIQTAGWHTAWRQMIQNNHIYLMQNPSHIYR